MSGSRYRLMADDGTEFKSDRPISSEARDAIKRAQENYDRARQDYSALAARQSGNPYALIAMGKEGNDASDTERYYKKLLNEEYNKYGIEKAPKAPVDYSYTKSAAKPLQSKGFFSCCSCEEEEPKTSAQKLEEINRAIDTALYSASAPKRQTFC